VITQEDLAAICWHDARVFRIVEDTIVHSLTMELDCLREPDWRTFERLEVTFEGVYGYEALEGPCTGQLVLLGASIIEQDGRWTKIRLDTTFGVRELHCSGIRVVKT
jgi:hypothetical protein